MEPSTIRLSASVVALPLLAKTLHPLARLLRREQPAKSWHTQGLELLRDAGGEVKALFYPE